MAEAVGAISELAYDHRMSRANRRVLVRNPSSSSSGSSPSRTRAGRSVPSCQLRLLKLLATRSLRRSRTHAPGMDHPIGGRAVPARLHPAPDPSNLPRASAAGYLIYADRHVGAAARVPGSSRVMPAPQGEIGHFPALLGCRRRDSNPKPAGRYDRPRTDGLNADAKKWSVSHASGRSLYRGGTRRNLEGGHGEDSRIRCGSGGCHRSCCLRRQQHHHCYSGTICDHRTDGHHDPDPNAVVLNAHCAVLLSACVEHRCWWRRRADGAGRPRREEARRCRG